ncbi:putative ferric-chelate reductase [Saccharomycopsis crataegensis]|uniref:ferric-chelate reductase (NADPH) n=1 Tax=Saccharomycopsis crataegensis TaxID=43959 RepID=A0AAV5QMY9_9ASCO|nr:putative ferric-chelate reductase [Saccharomycopsis crataegensis]
MVFGKRDLYAEGVWCINDVNTTLYKELKHKSQAAHPWAYQAEYGKYMTYYLVVIIGLFIFKRLHFSYVDEEDLNNRSKVFGRPNFFNKIVAFNRYITYRRLPITLCEYLGLPCSVANVTVLCSTLLYVLCYTFIPKVWYRACSGFGSPPLAIRAALECMAFIPFILILSGKSNIISTWTGVSYERLNVYHRWASFIAYFLAWVHIIPFYYQAYKEGGAGRVSYKQRTDEMFVNGIPPTVFFTWLCFASYTSIRQWWYELFFHLHWLCGIGFCISLYIHIYPELGSQNYLYATVALWGSQVLWRFVVKTALKPGKRFLKTRSSKARKFLVKNGSRVSESFEIAIENKGMDFHWKPGQHLFIRVPGMRILDNHPFSICNIPNDDQENIRLLVKPEKGLTRKIYNQIPESMTSDMKVFIDGPYGGTPREYDSFTNLYLFANGTGVSAVLPFLLAGSRSMIDKYSRIREIRLDWIIRFDEDLEWVRNELESVPKSLIESGIVTINVYCVNNIEDSNAATNPLDSESISSEENRHFQTKPKQPFLPNITNSNKGNSLLNLFNFKPIIKDLFIDIKDSLGSKNMIVCSGSQSMKFEVGNSVAALQTSVLEKSSKVKEVYLHTENFGW